MLEHMKEHLDVFACPGCSGSLKIDDNGIECLGCKHRYDVDGGIPLLFWPNQWDGSKEDVTDAVKKFYEDTPFPDYEEVESRWE